MDEGMKAWMKRWHDERGDCEVRGIEHFWERMDDGSRWCGNCHAKVRRVGKE